MKLLNQVKISERATIFIILFAALFVRLLFIISLGSEIAYPIRDQSYYLDIARNIAEGNGLMLSKEYWELRKSMLNSIPEFKRRFANLEEWLEKTPWGIIKAGEPTSFCTPLYPVFLGMIIKLFGENYIVIRLAQTIIGVALVLLVYLIGRNLFDTNIGFLAALVCSFYPYFIYYTGFAMTETLNITLIALLVFLYYKTLRSKSNITPFILGLVLAMTCLVRAMMFAFFFVIVVLLIFEIPKVRKIKTILLYMIGFLILLSPWIIRNYLVHNQFVLVPTTGGATLWMRNNPDVIIPEMKAAGYTVPEHVIENLKRKDLIEYPVFTSENEVERNKIITKRVRKFIAANPLYFFHLCKNRFLWYMSFLPSTEKSFWHKLISLLSWCAVLPFSIFGIVLVFIKRKQRDLLFILIIMFFYIGIHTLFHGGIRYRLPTDPFYILFASYGLIFLYDKLKKRAIIK